MPLESLVNPIRLIFPTIIIVDPRGKGMAEARYRCHREVQDQIEEEGRSVE